VRPQLAARTRALLGGNVARAREFFLAHPQFVLPEPPSCSVVFPCIPGQPDLELFGQQLLERHGVAIAPGRFFEAPGHFRMSLAGSPQALEEGLRRLGLESRLMRREHAV
jgi:aspartate/methionine/tyrosine aminotransferase